jgi:hypothetical protein
MKQAIPTIQWVIVSSCCSFLLATQLPITTIGVGSSMHSKAKTHLTMNWMKRMPNGHEKLFASRHIAFRNRLRLVSARRVRKARQESTTGAERRAIFTNCLSRFSVFLWSTRRNFDKTRTKSWSCGKPLAKSIKSADFLLRSQLLWCVVKLLVFWRIQGQWAEAWEKALNLKKAGYVGHPSVLSWESRAETSFRW